MSTVRYMAKIDCNIKPPHSAAWCLLFITSTEWWRLCFHLCWFVSLFVCVFVSFLSVSNITGKHMGRFSSNFQDMLGKIQGAIWKIWRVVCLTTSMQVFFYIIFKEIHVSEQYWGKTDERISMKFLGKVGHETRNNLKHLWDLASNTLSPGSIFLFSGSLFVSNEMEK